jgi:hypothetical protein
VGAVLHARTLVDRGAAQARHPPSLIRLRRSRSGPEECRSGRARCQRVERVFRRRIQRFVSGAAHVEVPQAHVQKRSRAGQTIHRGVLVLRAAHRAEGVLRLRIRQVVHVVDAVRGRARRAANELVEDLRHSRLIAVRTKQSEVDVVPAQCQIRAAIVVLERRHEIRGIRRDAREGARDSAVRHPDDVPIDRPVAPRPDSANVHAPARHGQAAGHRHQVRRSVRLRLDLVARAPIERRIAVHVEVPNRISGGER